jgi:hypothetical protein
MVKSSSKQKKGRCIFCGQLGKRTRTHIWPEWLRSILNDGTHRIQIDEAQINLDVNRAEKFKQTRLRQGGIFSQKPYLACEECNNGWMNDFEKRVIPFSKSLFASEEPINLTRKEVRSLCGWLSLIAILTEYNVKREQSSIPKTDRKFVKERLEPPGEWSIFALSQTNPTLVPFQTTIRKWYDPGLKIHEHPAASVQGREDFDTQLSVFGLGRVAFQLFTSPHMRLVSDFRTYAKSQGFVQLWPMPFFLNPFTSRFGKFPTREILDENGIGGLHIAYGARFEMMFGLGALHRFRSGFGP